MVGSIGRGVVVSSSDDWPGARFVVSHEIETADLVPPPFDGLSGSIDKVARASHAADLGARAAVQGQEGDLHVVGALFSGPCLSCHASWMIADASFERH